ncbi:hypothetical protein FGG08_002149 [Glutinoglossum americanum]|uniref:Fork-head domain-containing protein n=1 Tax=Glutinoglossum americanum TaxID=1670608 RepID=A0A9P8I5D9_9PEZI|nr:hypothetical protein FGG08_002149 [Glutinoglossum americanum]
MESPAQHRFEDTAIGFDYMCSHFRRRPSSAPSPASNDQPRMSISSIVNPSSATLVGSEFDTTSGFEQSSTQMAEPASLWPSYSGLCDYYNNPNYQTSQEFLNAHCDANIDYSFQGRMANGSSYDYSFPNDYGMEAISLTCPRSYQPEFGMVLPMETVVPSTEAYPPSSYLMDPQKHQSYMAISSRSIEGGGLLAEQDQETFNRLQIGYGSRDGLYSCASPAPSSHVGKPEVQISPSDGKDRASEDCDPLSAVGDDVDGEDGGNQPYAQLIYKALMSTPEHKMVLNEIYDWFRNTFEKFNKAKGKGWQNSIRHNLSMNGAFTKVEKSDDSAKGFIWVLEPSAIREGVKSTTRYRKVTTNKKIGKSETPVTPQRQASSATRRTGKSTKKIWKSNKIRKSEKATTAASPSMDLQRASRAQNTRVCSPPTLTECDPPTWTYYDGPPITTHTTAPQQQQQQQQQRPHIKRERPPFLFQDIVGVSTPYSGEPFFCDPSSNTSGAVSEYSSSNNNDPLTNSFFSSQEM